MGYDSGIMRIAKPAVALTAFLSASPALAADQPSFSHPVAEAIAPLPQEIQAIVDDAFETGTDAEIAAVAKFVRRAFPAQSTPLDTRINERTAQRAAAEQARLAAERERIASAGPLENWSGRGEIGASRVTGNTDTLGVYASLGLNRQGVRWRHAVRANAEVQETNGERTQERLLFAYEPNFQVNERLSAYALLQAERNPPLGFEARYAASTGLGLALVKRPNLSVDLQGGPAFRLTERIVDGDENSLSGRAGLNARWTLRSGLVLTQNATAYLDTLGNTFTSATGLEARLAGALAARLSYNLQYENDPAAGRVTTDTQSRVTLVYGF